MKWLKNIKFVTDAIAAFSDSIGWHLLGTNRPMVTDAIAAFSDSIG